MRYEVAKLLRWIVMGALVVGLTSLAVAPTAASADGGRDHHGPNANLSCRSGSHDDYGRGSCVRFHPTFHLPTVVIVPYASAYMPGYSSSAYGSSTAYAAGQSASTTAINVVTGGPLGPILVDDEGYTLYAFQPDQQSNPTCYGACSQVWPALMPASGAYTVAAGPGVQANLIGYVTRMDGSIQLTYNHWPLYRYAGDMQPGQANGQGLNSFGGLWHAVSSWGTVAY